MDAIAGEAHVTKQTVYRYYPGKHQLFGAVLGDLAAPGARARGRPAGDAPGGLSRGRPSTVRRLSMRGVGERRVGLPGLDAPPHGYKIE